MKALCTANRGSQLGDSYHLLGPSPESTATLTVGHEYFVLGMTLWDSRILLLVPNDRLLPMWYDIGLFVVEISKLPPDWFFTASPNPKKPALRAVWGYELLVLDPLHSDALIERDPKALLIFKNEMDYLVNGE